MIESERGFLSALLAWGGNLAGGFGLGWWLNSVLAPGSDWAWAVGAFALPLAFGIGMQMWTAAAAGAVMHRVAGAVLSSLWKRTDFRTEAEARLSGLRGKPIPGTNAFLLTGIVAGPLAGLLTAFAPSAIGVGTVLLVWSAVGIGYGVFLRWLARSGRLPMPDE